jgi:hypothetical protein
MVIRYRRIAWQPVGSRYVSFLVLQREDEADIVRQRHGQTKQRAGNLDCMPSDCCDYIRSSNGMNFLLQLSDDN